MSLCNLSPPCVFVCLQQDDERIIQEIQKEGEEELKKKCAGQFITPSVELLSCVCCFPVFVSFISSCCVSSRM